MPLHSLVSHESREFKKDQKLTSDDTHWTKWISVIFKFVTWAIDSKKEEKNHCNSYIYCYFDHIGAKADFLSVSNQTDRGQTRDLYFTLLCFHQAKRFFVEFPNFFKLCIRGHHL